MKEWCLKRMIPAWVVSAVFSSMLVVATAGCFFLAGAAYQKSHTVTLTECDQYIRSMELLEYNKLKAQRNFEEWCYAHRKRCKLM